MTDSIDTVRRSWNMGRIKSSNTKPELIVRSVLHRMGYRFRLHKADLPGTPDIVLPKYSAVVLVHGCFWHRHEGCPLAYTPKSRRDFWVRKFETNVARDEHTINALEALGWNVVTVWQCETRNLDQLAARLIGILR